MSEAPTHQRSMEPKTAEIDWATHSLWHLVKFYEKKSWEKDPAFQGYAECAHGLADALKVITESEEIEGIELFLKPRAEMESLDLVKMSYEEGIAYNKRADRGKLYKDENQEAAQALMLLAYKTLGAELLVANVDTDEKGEVIVHGRVGPKHVYFVEHYAKDHIGEYMSWTLMGEMPHGLVPQYEPADTVHRPFVTTLETRQMADGVSDVINDHGVINIDEARLVENYFGRNKAA